MKIKALVSFSSVAISMNKGEIRDYNGDVIALASLFKAGYIEEVKTEKPAAKRTKKEV